MGKPITYIETYLASEGFIAYQDRQDERGMRLVTSQHLFFEFVPFDDKNFDNEGNIVDRPEALEIHLVEEGRDYAILISTAAGAWRYLIGIRFDLLIKRKVKSSSPAEPNIISVWWVNISASII